MKNLSSRGSCLCGGIKFSTQGLHRHVGNCHCSQCMKTHGNYAAYTMIKDKNIKFFRKKTLTWYKSSRNAKRGFCNKCGASAFFKSINSNDIHISAGLFDKTLKLKTIRNIFTKNKLKYYKLDKRMPRYSRYSYKDKSG